MNIKIYTLWKTIRCASKPTKLVFGLRKILEIASTKTDSYNDLLCQSKTRKS